MSTNTAQFIFIKHGNNTDDAIDYVNSTDSIVTNWATGGPTGTDPGVTAPIAIQADLPGGIYYTIDPQYTGDGSADHGCHRPTFVCRHCGAPMLIIETFARAQHIRGPPIPSRLP